MWLFLLHARELGIQHVWRLLFIYLAFIILVVASSLSGTYRMPSSAANNV